MEFTNAEVNIEVLKQRAYNMRWAEVPEGVIPLTAADSDFPAAPEIGQALNDYISGGYFSYTPKLGYPSLREAVAKAMWERKGEKVNPDLVLPIDSAARGMDAIAKTVLELSLIHIWASVCTPIRRLPPWIIPQLWAPRS